MDDCDAITPPSLESNRVLLSWMRKTKQQGGRLHLIGLVSDGGVHSSPAHLFALLEIARRERIRVVVHAVLDGVDVPPRSALRYVEELEAKLDASVGRIGTVSGRAFAMDSAARWDKTEKVYRAIMADGVERVPSARQGIQAACAFGNPETFVQPFVVFDYPGVSLVDSALHFNFAPDGARELSHALAAPDFKRFARKSGRAPFADRYACMVPCDSTLSVPTLFPRAPDPSSLALDALADAGHRRLLCNDGSAASIATRSAEALKSGRYELVVADLADPDNAAHAAFPTAVDEAVMALIEAARSVGGAVVVVGGRDAANTFPVVHIDDANPSPLRDGGRFVDLEATLLAMLTNSARG